MKFRLLLVVLCLGLTGSTGWISWTIHHDSQLVEIADIAMEEIQALVKIRTAMNRQIKETLDYFVLGGNFDEEEYGQFQEQVVDGLQEWMDAAERSTRLQTPGEEEELGGIIILREKYQSVAANLNALLKIDSKVKEEKQFRLFLQSVELLEDINQGMSKKIEREIGEAEQAYTRLMAQKPLVPFTQESLVTLAYQAKDSLAFLKATDEITAQSISMMNAVHKLWVTRDPHFYSKFEEANQRKQEAIARWSDMLTEQLGKGVYQGKDMPYQMRKIARLLLVMDEYNHRALSQMQEQNFNKAGDTIEKLVEGTLDAQLIPSLKQVFNDGQEQFILTNMAVKRKLAETQYFALMVFGLGTTSLLICPQRWYQRPTSPTLIA